MTTSSHSTDRATSGRTTLGDGWIGLPETSRGVAERRFDLDCQERRVPGIVWTPEAARGPRPLVLLGHGGSLHKRSGYVLSLARRFVRHHGFAAAAIDGPVHGDRRPDGGRDGEAASREFRKHWRTERATDSMVADWHAALDALRTLDDVGEGPLGYWGLSMGTLFGLPFVASEPRVDAAVLGLMGITGPTADRIARDAVRITCPLLFLVQWDDELFPRDTAIDLFSRFGSEEKRLHASPGLHSAVPVDEFRASEAFLASRLAAARTST